MIGENEIRGLKEILNECQEKIEEVLGLKVKVYCRQEFPYLNTLELKIIICETCEVMWEEVVSSGKGEHIKIARQLYCYFAYTVQGKTVTLIGKTVNRDHTTVIHSCKRVQDMIDTKDGTYMPYYLEVQRRIYELIPATNEAKV